VTIAELRNQLLPPCPVIDVHVHPFSCFGSARDLTPVEDAAKLRAVAGRSGVTKMCLFSLHPTVPTEPSPDQCREANDDALAMRDAEPDVFIPFCYVNPMYPAAAVDEIARCVDGEGMVGVKLWVARRATDPGLDPILEASASMGVPVLQHAWEKTTGNLPGESNADDVADLGRRHPGASIIMAHMNGVGLRGLETVADVPNVLVDTSGGDPESGLTEAAVAVLGPDRVVYGSDAPIRHFGVMLGKVLGAGLSDEDVQNILWNNAARLLPERAGVKELG
jgi:predicted TIM-barrel fold metal-dependent hydrolase